jgi:hypothetical protein
LQESRLKPLPQRGRDPCGRGFSLDALDLQTTKSPASAGLCFLQRQHLADTAGTYTVSTAFSYTVCASTVSTTFSYAVCTSTVSTAFSYAVCTSTVGTAFSYAVYSSAVGTAFGYTVCAGTVSATFGDYRGIQLLVQVGGMHGYCASGQYGKGQAEDQFAGFHDVRSRSCFAWVWS